MEKEFVSATRDFSKDPKREDSEYGNWLPYLDESERLEARKWLLKWADCLCEMMPAFYEDGDNRELFKYYPINIKEIWKSPLQWENQTFYGTIAITFHIGKKNIDSKDPSVSSPCSDQALP